ncbi:hypothetical protein [Larsenimonas suaedae]|uniref:Uncharacterized protein n=1 Tax=Larsenimonas suaedae TaxID=1851019 RepID=A0ABU1H120_9GAMM|nr:hypothetical protein [Larsenimonas suaedae]MCM2973468.1 hypothetical protein [Larsenimonas suaedae]MDR5897357.1 hypothetical protein [Larsenimonas suaedae]
MTMPEQVRATCLSLVTERLIVLRRSGDSEDTRRERREVQTAAEWLLGAKGETERCEER